MTYTETRYFQNADITYNQLTCKDLGTSQTASPTYVERNTTVTGAGTLAIRVFKRSSNGSETEITSGYAAQMTKGMSTSGIDSATWDCPETALVDGDSIVIRVYIYHPYDGYPPTWVLVGTWQTENLSATQLAAATWTVYYSWNFFYVPNWYHYQFRYGDSSVDSRIENFTSLKIPHSVIVGPVGI